METTVHLVGTHYFRDVFPQLGQKSKVYDRPDHVLQKIYANRPGARCFMLSFQEQPAVITPDAYASSAYSLLPVFINGLKVGFVPEDFHKTYFEISRRITGIRARISGGPVKSVAVNNVVATEVGYDVLLTISY